MKLLHCAVPAALVAALLFPPPAGAQSGFNQTGAFVGTWCAQGDRNKRASIAANGPLNLTLTNENGSTSSGFIGGPNSNQITAPQWNLVQGSLSSDGQTINWSNNTYWTRCRARRFIDLQGTWYVGGDNSRPCRINQHKGTLSLHNESGQTGSGSFTSSHGIGTIWSGVSITGIISSDQNRIDWSNGSSWTR